MTYIRRVIKALSMFFIIDVSNLDSYPAFVNEVSSIVGDSGLNVLINNAGVLFRCDNIAELSYEKYFQTFQTNTFAPVFLSQVRVVHKI